MRSKSEERDNRQLSVADKEEAGGAMQWLSLRRCGLIRARKPALAAGCAAPRKTGNRLCLTANHCECELLSTPIAAASAAPIQHPLSHFPSCASHLTHHSLSPFRLQLHCTIPSVRHLVHCLVCHAFSVISLPSFHSFPTHLHQRFLPVCGRAPLDCPLFLSQH